MHMDPGGSYSGPAHYDVSIRQAAKAAFVTSSFKIFLTQTFPRCGATCYIAFEGDDSAIQWCQFSGSLYTGCKFLIPSMIACTLAVIGCDSLLFYARISLDKDLSCWRRLLQEQIAEIAECAKLNLSRLAAIDPVEVIILAQWINMY